MKSILGYKDFVVEKSDNWFVYQRKSLMSYVGIESENILIERVFDYLNSKCINLICLSNNLLLLGYYSYNKNS